MDSAATSSGARFYRCALQVNPHDYLMKSRGQASGGDPTGHAEAIVKRADELGVSVLAVTDHNDVSGISSFREAAEPHDDIHVLPGFELYSSDGIHVLCIYPEHTDEALLVLHLGEFGIKQRGDLANKSFTEILETVRKQDGVTVAAHATASKGLLKALQGQALIRAWKHRELLAVQIPGPVDALPDRERKIVQNRNAVYRRVRAAGDRLAVAVVNATDVVEAADLGKPGATCLIKMSEVSVEGLRQAFLDPDSRIRLNSAPDPPERTELVSLKWEGGFLDGMEIRFNQNLNVLVGGRGAGKSAVVESLRYALNLEPVGEEARAVHDGMVKSVLRGGTKVSLRVRSPRPSPREYLIERTVSRPPRVLHGDGRASDLAPQDVLQHAEVYGQHEISEIARTPSLRANLLNRFAGNDEQLDRRRAELRQELENSRKAIADTRTEIQQIGERLAKLPGLEEQLARYHETDYEARLRERSMLEREAQILDSIPDRLRPFRESLESLRQYLPVDLTFVSDKALDGLPGREIIKGVAPILERLSADLAQAADAIGDAMRRADDDLDAVRERWDVHRRKIVEAHDRILRELGEKAEDAGRFIELQREIEDLRPLQRRREQLERSAREQDGKRKALIVDWEDAKRQEFQRQKQAARKVNRQLECRVRVQVTQFGDREPLAKLLRNEIGGRLAEAIEIIRAAESFSLPDFAERCRRGAAAIAEAWPEVTERQAAALAAIAKPPGEVLMRIEELDLPSGVSIELNTAPKGKQTAWRPIAKLSTGQKATAVLLILLLEGDDPLIVDQPEDDLDNSFITDEVVPRMREAKRRRQFVFSTHNANIPVLGDAELILGLTPEGDAEEGRAAIRQEHAGAIDSPGVRDLVENILEGGRDAFERRRAKYGF